MLLYPSIIPNDEGTALTNALLDSINDHFDALDDPRRKTKNQCHEFVDILVIALCAVISGANHWTSVATFGRAKEAWFRTFLRLPEGIPSHDTFTDVFAKLDPEQFERCFIAWVSMLAPLLPGDVVSVDGKTLRRSHDQAASKRAIHLVSAWSSRNALVLGQYKTEAKSNEITAIPLLLDMLSLEGSLVTIDAMGCQKAIAERILAKGADYLLAVKENQPTLYEAIDRLFFDDDEAAFAARFCDYAESHNTGHGRDETRRCWVCQDLSDEDALIAVWPGLQAIVVVESHRTVGTETTIEHRFYITSSQHSAAYFLQATREHWHIENKLHWVLDVAFREDEARVRKGHGAENFAILRRMALNLLKQEKTEKTGIENKRSRAGWDQAYLEKVLIGLHP